MNRECAFALPPLVNVLGGYFISTINFWRQSHRRLRVTESLYFLSVSKDLSISAMAAILSLKPKPYSVTSSVRGFHVYRTHWKPLKGVNYRCRREPENKYDCFAVAVCHGGMIVGHVPREFSEIFSCALLNPGVTLDCEVIGNPYEGYGTELPCKYEFNSSKDDILKKIKRKMEGNL